MTKLSVAVLLISLTVLAVGCSPWGVFGTKTGFGGPYAYQGGIQKVAEFQWYKDHTNDLSKHMELNLSRLTQSIRDNRAPMGGVRQVQRYNYVITEEDSKIYVGVWSMPINWSTTSDWIKIGQTKANTCIVDKIAGGAPASMPTPSPMPTPTPAPTATPAPTPIPAKNGAMINFHAEDPVFGSPDSPCWLKASKDGKKVGILDAMTKHFMLANGAGTVESFDLRKLESWTKKEVAYAGEMFVLVSDSTCLMVINNGSGTYLPQAGNNRDSLKYLKAVAAFFSQKIPPIPIYAVVNEKEHFEVLDNPQLIEECP